MKRNSCSELLQPYQVAISAISVAELEYGVAKSRHIEQNRTALRNFLSMTYTDELDV